MALKVCYKMVDKLEEGRCSLKVIDLEPNPSPQAEQHPLEHAKDGFFAKGQTATLQRRYDANVVRCCPSFAATGESRRREH
jgi:hypothetical protein